MIARGESMAQLIYVNRVNYSRWLVIGGVIALAVFALGFITGEVGPLFFGIGGLWLVVIAFIAIVIHFAGSGQVAALSADSTSVTIESNGLVGRGLPKVLLRSDLSNWRWLTQAGNSRQIGPVLGMLGFNVGRKTYRMPLTTAQGADIEALRQLAPDAMDALLAKFPNLTSLPRP